MPQEREICCFWGGGALNYLNVLSLRSFVAAGHPVSIYAYDPPPNLPEGFAISDASDIAPQADAPAALIADYLRYRILASRPLRPEDCVLLARQSRRMLSPDVLALPPDSPVLKALIAFTDQAHPTPPWADVAQRAALAAADPPLGPADLEWGVWGALALTHFSEKSGEIDAASPARAFYPISYADRSFLLKRKAKLDPVAGEDVAAIPLYGEELARQIHEVEDGLPRYWTPLGALLRQFDIDPREAPIYGAEPKADGRWVDRGRSVSAPAPEPSPLNWSAPIVRKA